MAGLGLTMWSEGVLLIDLVPESYRLKRSPEVEPGGREEGAPAMEPVALPTGRSDPVQLSQTSMPARTAQAQGSNGVPGEHPEASSPDGREPVILPRAKIPGKHGKAQIAQADPDTTIDRSWIVAASKLGAYDPILLHGTHENHHRSTQVSWD